MRKNPKLEVVALQWLENSKMRIKESSYVKYANMLQKHILPEMGEVRMKRLTTEMVERFVQGKLTCGKLDGNGGLSEKTVKDILVVLKAICQFAEQMDIEAPCRFHLIRIRQNDSEIHVLGKQEQKRLEEYLMEDDSLLKTGVLISLYMGLRLGEVCALKKNNILYNEEILQVRFTMQRIQNFENKESGKTKIIVTEPKSNCSVRDIPIPAFLMKRLKNLEDASDNAYVLTGLVNKYIEPRRMENILKKYLEECQLEVMNYHTLRHTFATRCIEEGVDVKSLSEILGHANVNITLNRYVHSSMEQKRRCMEKLLLQGEKE